MCRTRWNIKPGTLNVDPCCGAPASQRRSSKHRFGPRETEFCQTAFPSRAWERVLILFAVRVLTLFAMCVTTIGCLQEMADQPRYEPYEVSSFFEDGLASRPLVPGTVARGHLRTDEQFYTGLIDGRPAETFPQPVTKAMLHRGRQRFDVFCAGCHGRVGFGDGMVVRRGFPRPPSYHIERLRIVPVGHYFDVMTNGIGRMPDFAEQIPPRDRWAIAAYIRALQLSQQAKLSDLPAEDQEEFATPPP